MTMSPSLVMSKCHQNTLHGVLIDFICVGPTIGKKAEHLYESLGIDSSILNCTACTGSEEQDKHFDTMKSCPVNIVTKSVIVAPFGAVQDVSCKDDYKVPSQMQGE